MVMRFFGLALFAMLWLVPEEASAQWGRYRGDRWYGPSYGGYHRGYYGGNGWGWRGGAYGSRFYSNPYYASPYYSTPSVYYYDSSFGINQPRTSTYYDPGVMVNNDRQARVQVRLPNASDELIVQNVPIPGTGLVRDFVSPDLTADKDFVYTISVRRAGSTSTQPEDTRKLEVRAGGTYTVDFTSRANTLPAPR
jgi:uncharacterized protein (TIGR03000 family)